jgi:hypothetical protein
MIAEVDNCEFGKLYLDNNQSILSIKPFDEIFAYYIEKPDTDLFANSSNLHSFQYSTVQVYLYFFIYKYTTN